MITFLMPKLRTIRWLFKYWHGGFYFVVHTACYCMDAIHLNGNVWIKCLYAKVRWWVYGRKMWACGREELALVWLCMHACMRIWYVFNCGFKLLSGSLIRKYMYGYTYMKVFTTTFCIFHYGFRAEMEFLCRYTNNETCSSTSYAIYERTNVCHRVYR